MNISKVLEQTEEMTTEFESEQIVFETAVASLTPEFLKNIAAITDYPKAIASCVRKWNVTSDDKGTMWPLDEVSLGKLPVKFLSAILDRIGESWSGEKKSVTASANG